MIGIVYGWAWVTLGLSVPAAVVTVRRLNRPLPLRGPESDPASLHATATRVHPVAPAPSRAAITALRRYEISQRGRG